MHRSVMAAAFALAVSGTALPLITNPAVAAPRPWQGPPISMTAGRIAFLKAEIGITPAQEALWTPLAAVMRQNAADREHLFKDFHAVYKGKNVNAVERLEFREKEATVHAQGLTRFLGAFKPLYAGLSPQQKHVADVLFSRFGAGRHSRGRR